MKREFIRKRKEILIENVAKASKPNSKIKMIILSAFIHIIVILTFMISVEPSESKKSVDSIVTIEWMEPREETSLVIQKIDDGFTGMIDASGSLTASDEDNNSGLNSKMIQANHLNQSNKLVLSKEEQIMVEKVVEFWQKYFLNIFNWQ